MGKAAISRFHDADVLLDIIDSLPTSIFVKNEALQFELSNAAHGDIIRASAAEILGRRSDEFHKSDDAEMFMARDRQVLESGQTSEWEESVVDPSGENVPYLTRRSRLTTADGKNYVIGTSANLLDLRKREAQYRALAETVPVGIWQVDENGRTGFTNRLLLDYLGLDAAALEAANIGTLLGGGRADFPGVASRFETDLGSATGQTRRVLVIGSGWLALPGNEIRSAIVSVVDISEMTEMKRINDEISRLNRELAGNMRMLKEAQDENVRRGRMAQLGQLTATVAHEIRNPLGAVRTAAFLIERKTKDKGLAIEQQLLRIGNGITRCDNIITQLLDFSRSRSLQCETLVADEWLAKIAGEEAEKLPAAISIRCQLGLGDLVVQMDASRMSRVIVNLMSNASEAMVGKGDEPDKFTTPEPMIVIDSSLTSRGVEISISDNGPGIAAEHLQKILEPLFTTKNFGTGLGLPAVEKILQEHGGGLEVASPPGEGARFTAWFPVQQPETKAA